MRLSLLEARYVTRISDRRVELAAGGLSLVTRAKWIFVRRLKAAHEYHIVTWQSYEIHVGADTQLTFPSNRVDLHKELSCRRE